MSNKLTRKSLAFGAMVALASSVIAGAPAQAAGEVVFAPTTGTSYNTLVTEAFSLNASLAPGQVAANITQLKYKIDSAVASSVWAKSGNAVATPLVADVASTTSFVLAATTPSSTSPNIITLKLASSTAATATTSVTVTAFLDSNSNNLLDTGEFSQAQTVKFVKYSEVVPTVTLTTPVVGATTLTAAVALADVNTQQLTAASYLVAFTGTGTPAITAIADVQVASGSATTLALSRALAAADVVTAQAKYGTTLLGTAVSATVAATTVRTVVGALVEGANAKLIGTAPAVPTIRLNTANTVKATLRGEVVSPATVGPVLAGKAVTVAVTGTGTLTANRTLSINGTVYNGTTAVPASIALTSDANGEVSVELKSTGFVTTDADLVVTFASEAITATAVTIDQVATAYAITADLGNLHSTKLGTAKAVALSVKDQFGTLSAETTDRLAVTPTVTGLTGYGTPAIAYLPLVGGKATYTASSGAATTAGVISLSVALQSLNTATQNYDAASPAVTPLAPVLVNVTTAADSFTTSPAATATAKVTADAFTTAIADVTDNATYTVVVANEGTALTVAAPGAYIKAGTSFGEGTVTVNTPTGGSVAVVVYFQKVGSTTVTFTNGVAVKTSVVTVTSDLLPALVSIVAPAQAQVGQAMDVVINVTDKWGNVRPTPTTGTDAGILSVKSTGTGYFASSAPVANASGVATVKYIVGTADIGTAFLSATLDLATDVTAARSVEFGLTDGDVVAGGKRVFVSAEFAKGRTVSVSVNGKRIYSKVQTTDNAVELAFTQRRAGTYTVTVRISGGITFTEKVTVG